MARILITNYGTHSADKWAVTTAEMIFPLEDTAMVGERLIAAQKFQTQLAEILSPHHENNMTEDKDKVEADSGHFYNPHEVEHHVDAAMEEIKAAAENSPWKDHFNKPEVQDAIRGIIDNHMHSAAHATRLWHAAHNRSEAGDHYLGLAG
jgi:hypothetical protein